jgi:hypothetical protein
MRFPVPSLRRDSLTAIVVVVICLLVQSTCAAVLAIDYGTEWTKAALVKPGIPLQIVLTKDTKRKEQSVVSFKKSERLYGTDAFNLVPISPSLLHGLTEGVGRAISRRNVPVIEDIGRSDGKIGRT